MNHFFFLAAGYGKRMGIWTQTVPKPLLKIDEISFLDYSLYLAFQWGVSKAWINTHYLSDLIQDHLKNFCAFPLKISPEKEEILGTAGGIRSALSDQDFNSPLVLFNLDTLLFPASSFTLPNKLPPHSKIHLFLSRMEISDRYTKITLQKDGRILFGEGEFFYIGLAIIDPSCLKTIPPNVFSDLSPLFNELADSGEITGEIFQGTTLDLGEKEKYEFYRNQNVFGNSKTEILNFISKYVS